MSVVLTVEVNGKDKRLKPEDEIVSIVNFLLIDLFYKQVINEELVRSEKMILSYILNGIPFQCVVIANSQIEIFKEDAKKKSIIYHAIEHSINKKWMCLFFGDSDTVSVNEVIRNNNIRIIDYCGLLKSEDPDYVQHSTAAKRYLNSESLFDVHGLYDEYTEDGGTAEDCKNYLIAVMASSVLEDLNRCNTVKGIYFSGLEIKENDRDLRDTGSGISGGHGELDYFKELEKLEYQAAASTNRMRK